MKIAAGTRISPSVPTPQPTSRPAGSPPDLDALALQVGNERLGVERGLGRVHARRDPALGQPAGGDRDRDRRAERAGGRAPPAPGGSARDGRSPARRRGSPSPGRRSSLRRSARRPRRHPRPAARAPRRAPRAARPGPSRSSPGREARPISTRNANPSWIGRGSASRHRTSRTPGIVRGSVAGSEWSVYIAGCVPTGSGNSQSTTPEPAGTSSASPSSNTIAGSVNSSSDRLGRVRHAEPGGVLAEVDGPVHHVDRTHRALVEPVGAESREHVRDARAPSRSPSRPRARRPGTARAAPTV